MTEVRNGLFAEKLRAPLGMIARATGFSTGCQTMNKSVTEARK